MDLENSLTEFKEKVEEETKIIAEARDRLRYLTENIEAILESVDSGIDNIQRGLVGIQCGIDDLSKQL